MSDEIEIQGPNLPNRRLSFLGHYMPNADLGKKPRRLLAKVAAAYRCKSGWRGWQEGWRYAHCTLSFIIIWRGGRKEGWLGVGVAGRRDGSLWNLQLLVFISHWV